MTKVFANVSIVVGLICFLANPFCPYWSLGISGSVLIAGGIIANAIIERGRSP